MFESQRETQDLQTEGSACILYLVSCILSSDNWTKFTGFCGLLFCAGWTTQGGFMHWLGLAWCTVESRNASCPLSCEFWCYRRLGCSRGGSALFGVLVLCVTKPWTCAQAPCTCSHANHAHTYNAHWYGTNHTCTTHEGGYSHPAQELQ